MFKNYTVTATTLLPVHVGGGDEYNIDPLDYTVKEGFLYKIDMGAMFETDSSFAASFVKESEKPFSIIRLRKLIHDSFDKEKRDCWIFRSKASREFENEFKTKLSDSKNQLVVQCMLHSGNNPIIPGSSIKGAFRTALLDARSGDGKKSISNYIKHSSFRDKSKIAEGEVLGVNIEGKKGFKHFDITSDPFKGLKISDAILPEDSTEIVCVRNVSLKNTEGKGIPMWVETVRRNTQFNFELACMVDNKLKIGGKIITVSELVTSSFRYFQAALFDEDAKFYQEMADSKATDCIGEIEKEVYSMVENKNATIIRLGRFSHLESMTFSGELRMPEHRRGWGNTRNLVNGKIPLGVIKLEFIEQ